MQEAAAVLRAYAGETGIVLYVVPRRGMAIDAEEVRAYCKKRLPNSMVPLAVLEKTRLPLTPTGRLDRTALRLTEEEPPREAVRDPKTREEQLLCRIFAEVLRLPRVEVNNNFFEIGGHSLLAMQVMSAFAPPSTSNCRCAFFSKPRQSRSWRRGSKRRRRVSAMAPNIRVVA